MTRNTRPALDRDSSHCRFHPTSVASATHFDRRTLLQGGLAAAAAIGGAPLLGNSAARAAESGIPLRPLGKVTPRKAADIEASPLGVGFEVLDRKCFDPEKTYPYLAELGAKWARCQTGWNRCEPERGVFDFAWLDEVVDALRKIGVQPWFNLGYCNRVYIPQKPDEQSVGWAPIFDDEPREAWLRFVAKIAEHFRDRVKHWEIWNEPNITHFWKPRQPNAADYVEMVRITAPLIRRAIPDVTIIGGAYAGIPMAYIKGCFDAGMAEYIDRLSYHPYRAVPEAGYVGEIAALRKLIAQYSDRIEIWQGENGCPSKGGPGTDSMGALRQDPWTEERQAKWLTRRILMDLLVGVELTSYFHTVDLTAYRTGTNYKGLLRGHEYTPKPAYFAYQCLCALFDAQTKRADLTVTPVGSPAGAPPVYQAGFTRRGKPLAAYWRSADPRRDNPPERLDLVLSGEEARFVSPVLISPLTQQVYELPPPQRDGETQRLAEMPLLDYALVIAERDTFDWS